MNGDRSLAVFRPIALILSTAVPTAGFIGRPHFSRAAVPDIGGTRAVATATAAKNKNASLDELLQPECAWAGRMAWSPDAAGNDERDWYINFHVTTRDKNTFRGRINMGQDGHTPRSCAVNGEIRGDEIAFITAKEGNLQMEFRGALAEGKILNFNWTGSDGKNRKRTGTATLRLKNPGPATTPSN